ncbi:MAG: DUF167 family protein [Candidatus Bathyarchaeia archaeon]|jgi:uncharacterized protein (TIGR00251 family)
MRITVEVKTESHEDDVEKIGEGHYLVRVREPRKKGKANQAILKLLKRHFGKHVFLVSGATSTIKIIEVEE